VDPSLAAALRSDCGLPDPLGSVALLDWTAFEHARRLLDGSLIWPEQDDLRSGATILRCDPFVALADLGSVLSAVILYDRVLVIAAPQDDVNQVNELLGLEDVIRRITPGFRDSAGIHRLEDELLHDVWGRTWHLLERAEREEHSWLQAVRDLWAEVLPDALFPVHNLTASDHLKLRYSTCPARPTPIIWEPAAGQYHLMPAEHLGQLILDNDVPALFYDQLAQELGPVFSAGETGDHGLTVRYVGGCLRSPMLLARAGAFLGRRSAEGFLAQEWRAASGTGFPVELPLWMDAVLASSRRRSDICVAVRRLRRDARRFRRRRAELERQLRRGNVEAWEQIASAMRGEAGALSSNIDAPKVVRGLAELGTPAAGPFAPALGVAAEQATKAATRPLRRLVDRYRRPELWLIYRMRSQAQHARASLAAAAEVFDLPTAVAINTPDAFLQRLGQVAWIA
jgi:hypothetical protein